MKTIEVLLSEEHVMIRESIRCMLEGAGEIRVIAEADDMAVAVAQCRQLRPPVVLTELSPPGLPPWLAISEILSVSPDSKVIVLSAREDADTITDALAAGAAAFVPKRASVEELLQAIRWAATGAPYVPKAISGTLFAILRKRTFHPPSFPPRPLTPLETQVCRLVAEGRTNREIGRLGGLSPETVRNYRKRVMRKLGARGVAELTCAAIRLRLLGESASHAGDGSENPLFDVLGERSGMPVPLHSRLPFVAPLAKHA